MSASYCLSASRNLGTRLGLALTLTFRTKRVRHWRSSWARWSVARESLPAPPEDRPGRGRGSVKSHQRHSPRFKCSCLRQSRVSREVKRSRCTPHGGARLRTFPFPSGWTVTRIPRTISSQTAGKIRRSRSGRSGLAYIGLTTS
jgi:hypothetical protein